MTARAVLTLAIGLLWVLPVFGAVRQHQPAAPDPELIEFLGSFETAGSTEVDPLVFADDERPVPPVTEKRKSRGQERKKPTATTRRETERTEQ